MKKIILLLLLLNMHAIYSQIPCSYYCLNFEDTTCMGQFAFDTTSSSPNIWQIGHPNKPSFGTAASMPNVIITDSLNPYPPGNYSAFTTWNPASWGDIYGFRMFHGMYNVQTDSLKDYGRLEFSPDNGNTWVDLINDTVYNISVWSSPVPVLTGNSNGWRYFDILLTDIGSVFNLQFGDTLIYRISFTSDTIPDTLGGLMFDDLCFQDFVEGISEIRFRPIKSKIYPNPSSGIFSIDFENPDTEPFELSIYDIHSHLLHKLENITENKIRIDTKNFTAGIYVYKLTNLVAKERSWGKFIITE